MKNLFSIVTDSFCLRKDYCSPAKQTQHRLKLYYLITRKTICSGKIFYETYIYNIFSIEILIRDESGREFKYGSLIDF